MCGEQSSDVIRDVNDACRRRFVVCDACFSNGTRYGSANLVTIANIQVFLIIIGNIKVWVKIRVRIGVRFRVRVKQLHSHGDIHAP